MSQVPLIALIANGDFGCDLPKLIASFTPQQIVACDGAYVRAVNAGIEVDYVVGDGDSIGVPPTKFIHIAEQDTNDLEKAFRFALTLASRIRVAIFAASGLREDHLLGNIFRLLDFAKCADEVIMISDFGRFDVMCGERTFTACIRQAVSIFATDSTTHVHSTGLEWSLDEVRFTNLYCATLNRATATTFTLRSTAPILVYRANV